MARQHQREVPQRSRDPRIQLTPKIKDRGRSSCLAPCPLSGEEVNPARRRAIERDRNSSHSLFNVARKEAFMSKLHRSLLGALLGAGLAIGGSANAKDLTRCWAAWDSQPTPPRTTTSTHSPAAARTRRIQHASASPSMAGRMKKPQAISSLLLRGPDCSNFF